MTPYDSDHDDRLGRGRAGGGAGWLVAGGVGCVLLVIGCGGLVALGVGWATRAVTTDLPAATAAADEFLDRLGKNQIDAAYDGTTAGFRGRQSRDEFRAFVGRFETLTTATSRAVNGVRLFETDGRKQAFIQVTLHAARNATTCTLSVVRDGDAWRVDALSIP